ncbi:GtrA family protein [Actinomadura mexicana]|uniref:Putative flippase GtrA (Transmembrane translocase of bactoprenol-linked glucose) n=1 Tax=Actinomadura mexicana TaxID=134959 RepID=A0A238YMC5_9ACTN|nr:GtrA family protein [Actinomadura mexicana]SNR71794.1 Putative flippase GtrA (transmembrane translocase of bactoprenol-linked glucose) [Actinomadura mexicana]
MQRSRPAETVTSATALWTFLRELLSFGFVGCVGTLIMFFGANLMRAWLGGSPVTSVVVPTVVSTLSSYLLNRFWTFRHRDSDGSGREVAIFFALNGVGLLIQVLCTGFTYYTLGLHGGIAYNLGLLAGVGLGSVFRYWSYKKWVFTPATA